MPLTPVLTLPRNHNNCELAFLLKPRLVEQDHISKDTHMLMRTKTYGKFSLEDKEEFPKEK